MGTDSSMLVSSSSLLGGVVVGVAHAGATVLLWHYFGLDDLGELLSVKPLVGTYVLLGMFALGFVPALLYGDRQIISPAVVVGGCLVLSVAGSWVAGPARAPAGTPPPFGVYILLWVGIVTLAGVVGAVEHTWTHPATR